MITLFFLCMLSIAFTHEHEKCKRLDLIFKGAATGTVTTRPQFVGLERRDLTGSLTLPGTSWLCWNFNLCDRSGKAIGKVEDCVVVADVSTGFPYDILHVTSFKIKGKGKLVVASLQSVFADTARATATNIVLVYTGTVIPGESKILASLSTKKFKNAAGFCNIEGVQDQTAFVSTILSSMTGQVYAKRMEFDCKVCENGAIEDSGPSTAGGTFPLAPGLSFAPPLSAPGGICTAPADCTTGSCPGGTCCVADGSPCITQAECCSGVCTAGTCASITK